MPYITQSRKSRLEGKVLEACDAAAKLFANSIVIPRSSKSVKQIIEDACSRGFSSVIILSRRADAVEASILRIRSLGSSYSWGRSYGLDCKDNKVSVYNENEQNDAEKEFIKEAQDD